MAENREKDSTWPPKSPDKLGNPPNVVGNWLALHTWKTGMMYFARLYSCSAGGGRWRVAPMPSSGRKGILGQSPSRFPKQSPGVRHLRGIVWILGELAEPRGVPSGHHVPMVVVCGPGAAISA